MAGTAPHTTSEAEEMYLITIARAVEDGHSGPVPIPHVAERLSVTQVAVNEMIKKLSARGFVEYVPYKGATLTVRGDAIAQGVLRRRRLWGVFLTDRLGLSPDAADAVACEFEHVTPEDVETRLAAFLNEPRVGHQGRPIPAGRGTKLVPRRHVADLDVGGTAVVSGIDADGPVASFLAASGVTPGTEVTLLARTAGGAALISVAGSHVELAPEPAAAIVLG